MLGDTQIVLCAQVLRNVTGIKDHFVFVSDLHRPFKLYVYVNYVN